MRFLFLFSLVISLVFSWDLLCLVDKVDVKKQTSLRCSADKLNANAVEIKKIGDLFVYKMKNGAVLFCEENWLWSFDWFVFVGRENFASADCSSYYKNQ